MDNNSSKEKSGWPDPEDRLLDSLITMWENGEFSCQNCKYFHEDRISCDAFPGDNGYGIPSDLLTGQKIHTKPLSWQKNNIIFEDKEGRKPKKRKIDTRCEPYEGSFYKIKSFVFATKKPDFMEFILAEDDILDYYLHWVGIREWVV